MLCALGDLLLDVVVRLDAPIEADTDAYGRTRVGAGGQAANVAAWAAELGSPARVIARRAGDPAGRLVAEELARRGVEVAGPVAEGRTGTVVSIATPDGRRAMLSDRGVGAGLAEIEPGWLEGCRHVHVSGYALPGLSAAALALLRGASVDLASTAAIEAAGGGRFRVQLAELRPSVVFANEAEAELVGALEAETVVVKRAERGCSVRHGGAVRDYAAVETEVVDATGAGDAFAAGFLLGGPELALSAAARCVATLGAMP
jgi:sugar/nucleoside kinase (ribokinase family)